MTPKVLDAVAEAWLSRRTGRRPPFVEWQGYALSGRQPEALGSAKAPIIAGLSTSAP
ncbi:MULTISPECIES: hypothetical protein [Mesorhizobium]|uniref:hypothetical protein n=1 Tax=Mesorhizobium sp. TaxID=1871066 RepID=UPI00140FAE17|nr:MULTISPECIES: hypothetical protein [Mesorhizobium]